MVVRIAVALSAVAVAVPALAEPLNAEAARRFVAGKLFASPASRARSARAASSTTARSPAWCACRAPARCASCTCRPGTLFAKGETICSQVKGAFFNPVLQSQQDQRQELPRRGLGLRLCLLRFHARGGGARDDRSASGHRPTTSCRCRARSAAQPSHAIRRRPPQDRRDEQAGRGADARPSPRRRCRRSSRPGCAVDRAVD